MQKTNPSVQTLKPTREQLDAARGKKIPDVIGCNLTVLFSGINPGLYSGATGHHFARPGNRFWPLLHEAGFTPTLLSPAEEQKLLELGYGITNIVNRTTAGAKEVSTQELKEGGQRLLEKVAQFRPRFLAILGIEAYRIAFSRPGATVGSQPDMVGSTTVWVLPNPSGANAAYQFTALLSIFGALHHAVAEHRG